MQFTEYRDIFGKPNEGIHERRFLGMAVWDIVFTLIAAVLITLKYRFIEDTMGRHSYEIYGLNVFVMFICLFLVAQIFHYIFGVKTAFLKMIKMVE
jgi:hypothetical protein